MCKFAMLQATWGRTAYPTPPTQWRNNATQRKQATPACKQPQGGGCKLHQNQSIADEQAKNPDHPI